MRILQVNNYADKVGGAEVYALALTRELTARGHTVAFFGTHPEEEMDEDLRRVVRRPRYDASVLYGEPRVRAALQATVQRHRPDLIHVHNVWSLGLDVLQALGETGVPVVQTVHDFSLLCPNSWCVQGDGTVCSGGVGAKCFAHDCQSNYPYDPDVALHTLLKHHTLNGVVDLSICPSLYLAGLMRDNGARDVRHLNYFIDPIERDESLRREDKQLVFIGRLEHEKGIEYLLEAMPRILSADDQVRLTIVGGGILADDLQQKAASLGLGRAVEFISHVPREELGRYYATATACVLPSIWSENSPLVAYECLAAGMPMLGSRIGGIPELARNGEAGFTFTPRDAGDLADKALQLLGMPREERERMSERMRARAVEYNIPDHMERIEALYAEVLDRPRSEPAPQLPIDLDLLAVLRGFREEKERLAALFQEHVGYIRHLEKTLQGQAGVASSAGEHRRLISELEASLEQHRNRLAELEGEGPRQLIRRLARALNLPKVFRS